MRISPADYGARLDDFFDGNGRLFVLTGAGVSGASGLPVYRDEAGNWKHNKPMQYQEFIANPCARQAYWARSVVGWQRFVQARPNATHDALARLASRVTISALVTQNVDRLHQRAGSPAVIDLHGNLDEVVCLQCARVDPRNDFQQKLLQLNPQLQSLSAQLLPDGDALLQDFDFDSVAVPECESCAGTFKPNVVFYGEGVPAERVKRCYEALQASDAMLVLGSSLMVYSGLRFVREAYRMEIPIVAINRGYTRADDLFDIKVEADCGEILQQFLTRPETAAKKPSLEAVANRD